LSARLIAAVYFSRGGKECRSKPGLPGWRWTSRVLVPNPAVSVPHNVGDTITVDLDLRGTQLTVKVGGSQVFDGALAIATDPGGVGLAVITGGTVIFDDFWVEALN
jgi:hypothetical protein